MTCHCPRRWCYAQPDCRHLERKKARVRFVPPVGSVAEAKLAWLEERRSALEEDLAGGNHRRSVRLALEAITAAIERFERP